jgi:hypothetical protein
MIMVRSYYRCDTPGCVEDQSTAEKYRTWPDVPLMKPELPEGWQQINIDGIHQTRCHRHRLVEQLEARLV